MLIEPLAQHHALLPLCPEMQAQFNIWNFFGRGWCFFMSKSGPFLFQGTENKTSYVPCSNIRALKENREEKLFLPFGCGLGTAFVCS